MTYETIRSEVRTDPRSTGDVALSERGPAR
jgi:hypothetical protein